MIENQGRFFIYHATSETTIECNDDRRIIVAALEVDPATVGQYTGLKDKKGRDIYEGDIILFGGICFEISYADGCFWFSNEEETMELHTTVGMGDIEITGNIHDNPDLLK